MPRHFEGPVVNYRNVDEFKETAVKTLNNLFGKKKLFDVFDFSEIEKDGEKFYHAVAYHDHEVPPDEQKSGEELSQEQEDALEAGEQEAEEDESDDDVIIHCTVGARAHAALHHVDLAQVTGTGENGKISQKDVQAYLKTKAPEKDKANEDGING